MEARKITIVSTKAQKKYVVTTEAETLGQLKADLDAANIDYCDMAFMEGLTRTEMKDDASLLPKDVERTNRETGETYKTNELVFMLTNVQKKIASGADRKEVYQKIKELNLQNVVKEVCGKNYTQVATDKLLEIIEASCCGCGSCAVEEPTEVDITTKVDTITEVLEELLYVLYDEDYIETPDFRRFTHKLKGLTPNTADDSPYSDEEISEMFDDIL